jgi:hypothetical protein
MKVSPREIAEHRATRQQLKAVCASCLVTVREGDEPVTHMTCPGCEERYERELSVIDIEDAFLDATFAYATSSRTGRESDKREWLRLHAKARAMLHGIVRGSDLLTCRTQKKDAADGAKNPDDR